MLTVRPMRSTSDRDAEVISLHSKAESSNVPTPTHNQPVELICRAMVSSLPLDNLDELQVSLRVSVCSVGTEDLVERLWL
jgi:hypothetical protein